MKKFAWLLIIVNVVLILINFAYLSEKRAKQSEIYELKTQIEKIGEVGTKFWYDERAENPGFDPKFSISCRTNLNDGTVDVIIVRNKKDGGYDRKVIRRGGIVEPHYKVSW